MVFVIRRSHIDDSRIEVFIIFHTCIIHFLYFPFVDEFFYHIFGRADDIIVDGTGFVFRVHFFRTFVFFVFYSDTGFFFECLYGIFVDVFTII